MKKLLSLITTCLLVFSIASASASLNLVTFSQLETKRAMKLGEEYAFGGFTIIMKLKDKFYVIIIPWTCFVDAENLEINEASCLVTIDPKDANATTASLMEILPGLSTFEYDFYYDDLLKITGGSVLAEMEGILNEMISTVRPSLSSIGEKELTMRETPEYKYTIKDNPNPDSPKTEYTLTVYVK